MPATFEKVEQDVLDLVQEAIDNWHPALHHARIGVCLRSEPQKRGDSEVWAAISKVSPHVGVLARLDYVLWLAKPIWEQLPRAGRLALLDHELCHATQNDNYDWAIREHDIEEFYEIIERHGFWRPALTRLVQSVATAQLRFPELTGYDPAPRSPGAVITLDPAAAGAALAG